MGNALIRIVHVHQNSSKKHCSLANMATCVYSLQKCTSWRIEMTSPCKCILPANLCSLGNMVSYMYSSTWIKLMKCTTGAKTILDPQNMFYTWSGVLLPYLEQLLSVQFGKLLEGHKSWEQEGQYHRRRKLYFLDLKLVSLIFLLSFLKEKMEESFTDSSDQNELYHSNTLLYYPKYEILAIENILEEN